jgi:hypothetical protein
MNTQDLLQQFRKVFPTNRDYYVALGFFQALGLSDNQASALAESVSELPACQEDL